jgi:hypothetical protein
VLRYSGGKSGPRAGVTYGIDLVIQLGCGEEDVAHLRLLGACGDDHDNFMVMDLGKACWVSGDIIDAK